MCAFTLFGFGEARIHSQIIAVPETYWRPSTDADTSKPGFLWNIFHNAPDHLLDGSGPHSNARADQAMSGSLKDSSGSLVPNEANSLAQGAATVPGIRLGTESNALIQFIVPGVINFSQNGGENNGSLVPDLQMPGVPGITGSTDGHRG